MPIVHSAKDLNDLKTGSELRVSINMALSSWCITVLIFSPIIDDFNF